MNCYLKSYQRKVEYNIFENYFKVDIKEVTGWLSENVGFWSSETLEEFIENK